MVAGGVRVNVGTKFATRTFFVVEAVQPLSVMVRVTE